MDFRPDKVIEILIVYAQISSNSFSRARESLHSDDKKSLFLILRVSILFDKRDRHCRYRVARRNSCVNLSQHAHAMPFSFVDRWTTAFSERCDVRDRWIEPNRTIVAPCRVEYSRTLFIGYEWKCWFLVFFMTVSSVNRHAILIFYVSSQLQTVFPVAEISLYVPSRQ